MSEHSRLHAYLNSAKERIDEMDAVLASLEHGADQAHAAYKAKADELVADLKHRRAEFAAAFRKHADAGEAAWERAKAQMDSEWAGFDKQVRAYMKVAGNHTEQQAAFRDMAAAQARAWNDAIDKLHHAGEKMAAAGRAELETAVNRFKAEAADAEKRLDNLRQAGRKSWAAYGAALAESRKAFDRANETAWNAIKHPATT